MGHEQTYVKLGGRASGLALTLLLLSACAPSAAPSPQPTENVGEAKSRTFTNGGFEAGATNMAPPSWTVTTFLDPGVTITTPQTRAGLNLQTGGVPLTLTLNAPGGPESQTDPSLGAGATLRWPKYGNNVAIVNQLGKNQNVNSMKQTMTVATADIDSVDGLAHVRFVLAPVLENPNHTAAQQPYYFVQLDNLTRGLTLYNDYNASAQPGVPWKISNGFYYTDWQLVDIAPGSAKLAVGDQIQLEIIGSGCSLGGHFGQVYVDGVGSTVPGPFVTATGPTAANAGSNITYTLTYKNGGSAGVGGATVEFNIPPNTTYQAISAPGLTCTTPPVAMGGLVSCTLGTLAPGASGSFTVTVLINPAATGTITAGNYDIYGTSVSPLLGPKVNTTITSGVTYADLGITITNGLSSLVWGQPVTYTVVATNAGPNAVTGATVSDPVPANLTNVTWTCVGSGGGTCAASGAGAITDVSVALPVSAKVTYTVTGTVASGSNSGTLADIATVTPPATAADPNPANNSAGDIDPILSPNGIGCMLSTDCVSAVCDVVDHKCGYANGDGPCTTANGATVCRSTACSVNGLCEPVGGCNVDGDCAGGKWCLESMHTCSPQLANGTAIPSDPPHTNPTLAGTCSATAGTLVCVSSVCDTKDNACGFANGDGPCTTANGATVCRSTACSVNGLCEPVGGCNVDGDCAGGKWCLESMHTCSPQLANGTAIPSDPPHTNPTLAGTCSAAAGTLVCTSGVCDTSDNKCGFANGDGPCTTANGATVCRSGACSAAGSVCIPAGGCAVDADCAATSWCNTQTFSCTPKLPNSSPIPIVAGHAPPLTGVCTMATGAAVCVAGVCDLGDNLCGFANGDGPCTMVSAMIVCRSGACSVGGTCVPVGGCNVDGDCSGGNWCNVSAHTCAPKIGNGGVLPTDAGHTGPTLDGKCTTGAATLVCVSGVCDTVDNRCGFANGDGTCTTANAGTICRSSVCDPDSKCGFANADGPCTQGNAPVVCRSGACSVNGAVCVPLGGCAVDADCGASEWCNSQSFTCAPKLANGTAVPTVTGHTPPLTGTCTTGAGAAVCTSAVCDVADNLCGFANGDGPCTAATGAVVCRSGTCSATGVCKAATACNADADCQASTQFCDTGAHLCAPKLPNGKPLPTVTGHQPALDGVCSITEAPIVCQSGVCDINDNKCGFASGDGPCTTLTAGTVCRSSTCSPNGGVCVPSGGCAVDADCTSAEWCNTQSFTCAPKLANGTAVPTVTGHAPPLTGKCTTGAGSAVCTSGVCDTVDDKCGYANGDGPCTMTSASTVCRAGACTVGGVCTNPTDCAVDSDCNVATQYCNTAVHVCAPKLPNGAPLPAVSGHAPSLDGTCSDTSAKIVCQSGVCDVADNACGHAIGKGPCDAGDGAVVCRSLVCALLGPNQGTCVECLVDTQCQGSRPVCDPNKDACVQCTSAEAAACTGTSPVCTVGPDTCAPCKGDLGDGTTADCAASGAPYCFLAGLSTGQCGKCTVNADCAGHKSGPLCDTSTGACSTACHADADCEASAWCNAPAGGSGACVPKLDNGTKLPASPSTVATCSPAVGMRVCKSGACDTVDDTCGLANGDGPCSNGAVCRSGACDGKDMKCGLLPADGPCTSDAVCRTGTCIVTTQLCSPVIGPSGCKTDSDCKEGNFCKSDGTCSPKLPDGATCSGATQCKSGACDSQKCDGLIASGAGLLCAASPGSGSPGSGDGTGAALLGLMLATAGLARRRRR